MIKPRSRSRQIDLIEIINLIKIYTESLKVLKVNKKLKLTFLRFKRRDT